MRRHIPSVIVAPMTGASRAYPSRMECTFQGNRGQVALDQIRTVARSCLARRLGALEGAAGDGIPGVLADPFSR